MEEFIQGFKSCHVTGSTSGYSNQGTSDFQHGILLGLKTRGMEELP